MSTVKFVPAPETSRSDSLTTPELDAFIGRLRDCRSLLSADAECQLCSQRLPGFEPIETNRFFYRGHEIELGLTLQLSGRARLLDALEVWNLHTLPPRADAIYLNGREMALVTRVGLPDARPLVSLDRVTRSIEPAHIAAVHEDAETLAAQGVMNPAFRVGLTAFGVEPSSGRIVIPAAAWKLEVFHRDELRTLHERIDQTFTLAGRVVGASR